jgi:oxygen-independent coproporphyrinogen III oxidase
VIVEFGLYVHVPYCRSLCPYCDFVKAPLHHAEPARLVAALEREWDLARAATGEWSAPRTVYVGGGTPTALPEEALERLLAWLGRVRGDGRTREFTVEANPEGLTDAKLSLLRSCGVDRLSLGVQSLEPAALKSLGRIHTSEAALDAADRARRHGFRNLSVDLMYGVPGETPSGFRAALETLIGRGVPHVSAYALQVEEGTPWAAKVARGAAAAPEEGVLADRYEDLVRTLRAAGYRHYEVSNFALPGFESKHNQGYWTRRPYLGLGPGAHSFDGAARWSNDRSIPGYMERVEAGALPREERHTLTEREAAEERIFLGLRRSRGLRRDVHLRHVPRATVEAWARWAVGAGAATSGPGGRVRPTDYGLFVAHDLAAELLARAS